MYNNQYLHCYSAAGFDDGNLPIYVIAAVGAALVLCIFSGCVRSCNRQRQAASPRYAEDIPAIQYQSSSSYVELGKMKTILTLFD